MALRISPKWLGNRTRKQRASRHKRPALMLEHLEIRATPAVLSWDGGAENLDWLNRFNWSTDTLPTIADDVTISGAAGAVEINNTFGVGAARSLVSDSGLRITTGTLQLATDSVIHGSFTLGGGTFDATINGTGNLRLTGNVVWLANGVMAGTGKTILEGTASLTGNVFGSIRDRVVENAGSATIVAGSSFNFRDAAVWHNLAGSTLNFSSGAGIGSFFAGPTSKLINEGTVNFSGPGTNAVAVLTENPGTLSVSGANVNLTGLKNSGAVQLTGGNLSTGPNFENTSTIAVSGGNLTVGPGTSSGAVELSNGATMIVTGTAFTPPFTLLNGATVSGGPIVLNTFEQLGISGVVVADAIRLAGGTLNGFVGSNLTVGTLEHNGTVTGPGDITVTDQWSFTGGKLTGSGRMITEGNSTFSGGFFATVDGRTVENTGAALVDAGASFTFANNGAWTNRPGSLFEVRTNSLVDTFFIGPAARFTNQGTILKTGVGTATIELPLANELGGAVQVQQGTLLLTGGGSTAGAIDVASGAALRLSGAYVLEAGTASSGAGEVQLTGSFGGGSLTVAGESSLANLRIENGTLTGPGPITVGVLTLVNGTINTSLTLGDWNFASGTLAGTGNVTVNGSFNWTGGSMSGTGRTILNGTSTLGGSLNADARQIENNGVATVTTGGLTFRNAARWTNLPGSVFEVRSGDPVNVFFATGQFVNQGTIRKTTTGIASIRLPIINQAGGVIDVQQGTLQLFANGGSSAGSFDITAGATLAILPANASFTLQAGATAVGAGEVLVGGSTVTIAGATTLTNLRMQGGAVTANEPLTVDNLTLSGMLTGPAHVTVSAALIWTGGSMEGTGKTILNGIGTIGGGSSAAVLRGSRTVDNAASIKVVTPPATPFQFGGTAVWNNLPGSVLELSGSAGISNFFATGMVNNAGTLRKTGAVGNVSAIGVPLINTGRMEILGGDLTAAPNSRSSGVTDIASAGRWVLNNGLTTLEAGATTTGAGVLHIQGGSLTVTGAANIARLQQNTSTTTVNAPLTIGDYVFNAGTLTGSGKTTLTGQSSLTGFSSRVVSNHTVDNMGTVTWSQSGAIQLAVGAVFNNLSGALFDITGDGSIAPPVGGATPAFNNAGTLRKSGGSGPIFPLFGPRTTWSVPLTNSGTLDVRTGNFQLVIPFGLPANVPMLANTGTILVGTATSSAAAIILPATSVFPNPPIYTLPGGTLTGTGQVGAPNLAIGPGATLGGTLTVHGNVVNRGTVRPGSAPGALSVTGNYTQVDDATADGRLVIGLRGDSGSGLFGKLTVNGSSQLAGALEVFAENGFLPDFGDVFQVFRSIGPRSGDFTYPEGGYDLDGYRVLTPQYDGSGLRLNLETEVGPLPAIDAIDDMTVNEGETMAFTATVSGAEPPGPLTFSLTAGSSAGATIDPATGAFEFFAAAGPGEYVFQIAASDPNAPTDPVDVETFKVTVLNVVPVVLIAGGQPELGEGNQFTASGSFTDPGADSWTATVDYGDGTGVTSLTLNSDMTFALDHHYLDNGQFTITVRVFDGHEYGTATFDVAVANLAPVVVAADDQTAQESSQSEFALGSFTDFGVSDAPWTVMVDWGDKSDPEVFDTIQQGLLDPRAHAYGESGTYVVTVTVTDKDGATASDTFAVGVANVAPVAAVNGPSSGVRGQVRTFTLSATDPSAVDQLAGFTFSIDWGDGTVQQVTGLSGTQVEHTFTDAGDYIVTVTATDEDGGASQAATHETSVVVAEVQAGVLVVGGTTGADQIQVKRGTSSDSLEVIINGHSLGEIGGLTRAVVYGQAGDDQLDATGSADVALELYGGAGNDHLKGGSKDDILDGGTGDDELIGGLGRDILIGGAGADRVISQSGDDILIGGLFMGSELTEARRAALLAVAAEWSSGQSFDERVETLRDDLAARVQDDGVADSLTGSSGSDWYFAHTSGEADELDALNGATSGDAVTTI